MRHVQARPGAYADSVTLMQVSAQAQAVPGVRAALVAMATELNLGLLADLGFTAPDGVTQNDLLIAVEAADSDALARSPTARSPRVPPIRREVPPSSRPGRRSARHAGPGLASR